MHKTVAVEMERDILEANRELANENHKLLKRYKIKSFDVMGAIGSGKTLLIEKIIDRLKEKGVRVAAIAGDVAGHDDYDRFVSHGIIGENISTGKECHLDAHLVEHAIEKLPLDKIDVLFIENVGNLVCPIDFPLGTDKRIVVISVTEGDDMVRKHPMIFAFSDVVVINKVDLSQAMEVDPQSLVNDVKKINPKAKIVLTDARHGQGLEDLMRALGL
ncbi:MAG: hydrogenase nickel incorporation protein HypB [Thermoplasmata archaeon]